MNSKMTTNSQLSTTEPKKKKENKNKLSKQLEWNRFTEIEITWRIISREREEKGENVGKGIGNKKHKW